MVWLLVLFAWLMSAPIIILLLGIVRYAQYRRERRWQLHKPHMLTVYPGGKRYAYGETQQIRHRKGN